MSSSPIPRPAPAAVGLDPSAAVSPVADRPKLSRIAPPNRRDKVRRLIWMLSWMVFARWTPVPLHGWRRLVLRAFGATIGPGAHIYPSAAVWAPWNLHVSDGGCLAEGVRCYNVAKISVGRGAVVSQYAYLCSASHDPHGQGFPLIGGPIVIGDDAWVAAEAFISPGVMLEDRAVAAARAVVVRHVPRATIVGGNPAKPIGDRRP